MAKKLLVSGASVAAGYGLPKERTDPGLWANRLSKHFNLDTENVSIVGADNSTIFHTTVNALKKQNFDHVLIQWQSIPNIDIDLGLETYTTKFNIVGVRPNSPINLVASQSVDIKKIEKIRNYFMRFYKEHQEIKNLIGYCAILDSLCKVTNTTVKHVNYNLPWGYCRFFDRVDWCTPDQLDTFTCDLLDTDLREDFEIHTLYELIHNEYRSYGPMVESDWANLYSPMKNICVDYADGHPGPKSQKIIFDFLQGKLTDFFN